MFWYQKIPIQMLTIMTRHLTQCSLTHSPTRQTSLPGYSFATLGRTNALPLLQHINKNLLKGTFSKSFTCRKANVKELYNKGIKVYVTTKDIKKEYRLSIKSSPDACCAEVAFIPLWLGKMFRWSDVLRLLENVFLTPLPPPPPIKFP